MNEPVGLRERLERLSNRGEDRGPEWLIASVNRSLTEPAPSVEPARRPVRRPLIAVAFAFAAVAAVVLAVVAFVPTGHSSHSPASSPPPVAAPVSAFDGQPAFFSAREGWMCHVPLEFTTDGGTTWQRIGIEHSGLEPFLELCAFAPGGHAWATTEGDLPDRIPRVVRVVAGPHRTLTFVRLPGTTPNTRFSALTFADALHGWALTTEQSNAPLDPHSTYVPPPATLYSTTDGGLHWQQIATHVPVDGGLSFSSPTTGWGLTRDGVARTDDGGRTWRVVPIAAVPAAPAGMDQLVTVSSVGAVGTQTVMAGNEETYPTLPAHSTLKQKEDAVRRTSLHVFLEVSNDGGAHWSVQIIPSNVAHPPFENEWQFVAVDADRWRYVDARSIASTDDAGTTWRVQPNRIPLPGVRSLAFVTPDTAFAVQCGLGTAPCHSAVTTDGGTNWRLTQPSLS